MSPRDNMEMWIKFANLCRKSGRLGLAEKTINSLLGDENIDVEDAVRSAFLFDRDAAYLGAQALNGPPHVIYAHLKFKWASGQKQESLMFLQDIASRLAQDLGVDENANSNGSLPYEASPELAHQLPEFTRLLARCYYKLGEWQVALQDGWGAVRILIILRTEAYRLMYAQPTTNEVLRHYELATRLDSGWYKAWHAWALANAEVVAHVCRVQQQAEDDSTLSPTIVTNHLVPAITCALSLRPRMAAYETLTTVQPSSARSPCRPVTLCRIRFGS